MNLRHCAKMGDNADCHNGRMVYFWTAGLEEYVHVSKKILSVKVHSTSRLNQTLPGRLDGLAVSINILYPHKIIIVVVVL